MKKLLTVCLVLIAVLCGALGLAACDQKPDAPVDPDQPSVVEHVHEWGDWSSDGKGNHTRVCKLDKTHTETEPCEEHLESVVTDPTCDEDGYTTHTCSVCDYSYTDTRTEKLGHDYEYTYNAATHEHTAVCRRDKTHTLAATACSFGSGVETLAPTCEADGTRKFTCEVCKGSYEETIGKLGHDYKYTFNEETHTHTAVCQNDPTHTLEATACSFDDGVETKPTCENNGYTLYTCGVCQGSYRDNETEKLGHDYEYSFDKTTKTHTAVCKRDETHTIEATACTFGDGVETLAPTCEADGEKTFTCEYCQGSYKETVGKLNHDWRYEFNAETHQHTAVCHNDETHKLGPTDCDMTNPLETKPTCTQNGYTSYICKVCFGKFDTYDEATQKATGHSYPDTWEQGEGDKHYHICTNPDCGHREEKDCAFTEVVETKPTCETNGYTTKTCPDCHASKVEDYQDALQHSFKGAVYHSNENGKHYRICTRDDCQEIEEGDCTEFDETTQPATCTTEGTTTKTCKACQYKIVEVTEGVKGHEFKDYKYEYKNGKHQHTATCENCEETDTDECILVEESMTPATCMTNGSEKDVCPICQHEETKVLDALGHNFEGATYTPSGSNSHYRMCTRNCGEEGARQEGQCRMVAGTSIPNTCVRAGSTASKRCPDCGRTEDGQVLPANGHTWKNTQNDGWTFSADGKHKRECAKCGFSEEKSCEYTERETAPQCTEDGERVKTCTLCKNVVTEVLTRLGHNIETYTFDTHTSDSGVEYHYHKGHCDRCGQDVNEACQLQQTNSTPATCTQKGTETLHCIRCGHTHEYVTEEPKGHTPSGGYKFNAEDHTHYGTCMSCGEEINPTACTPDPAKKKVQPRTCLVNGYTQQTCSECGNTWKEDELPSYGGHDWVVDKNSYQISTNKQYGQHAVKCSRCPANKFEKCTFSEETVPVTCEADGYTRQYCAQCGGEQSKTVVRTGGHVYQYKYTGDKLDHNTHRVTCENCDLDEEVDCTLKPVSTVATCTAGGDNDLYCTVCREVLTRDDTEALGHVFEYVHLYGNTHRFTCTRCRYSGTTSCTIDRKIEQGSCIQPTIQINTCRNCQNETRTSIDNPLGHQWSKWTVADNGQHVRNCENCQTQETRGGHDFSKSNFCDCGVDGLTYENAGNDLRVKRNLELSDTERIVIPAVHEGKIVVEIGNQAFRAFNMKEVVIPSTVTTIGEYAFNYCSNLTTITFGDTADGSTPKTEEAPKLTTIGAYAFQGDRELVTFALPDTLTTIGTYAFERCVKYDDFTVPESAEEIGKGAFNETKRLERAELEGDVYLGRHLIRVKESHSGAFTIKKGTLSVAEGAFENCANITTLTIYAGILRFDKDAFKGCTGLTSVTFQKANDEQTSDELLKAWFVIAFENDDASPLNYTETFNIVDLEGDVHIPDTATYIPVGTFRGDKITSIDIPNSVTHIGAAAFFGCTSLTKVEIPETVISIGAYAFYGCTALDTITFKSVKSQVQREKSYYIGENAFAGTKYYQTAENWDEHGILYIGKHLIKANSGKEAVVDTIATVPDLAQMTKIPDDVNVVQGAITLDEKTITISARAFENCDKLTQITIGAKVEFIGQQAFSGCSALTKATINGTVNFLAWSFRPGTTERYIGRSVNPNPNGGEKSQSDMAHWLTAGYPGEWARLVTA